MTQTDAEIVARALRVYYGVLENERAPEADGSAAAVVAALTEAGRLVPDGCVAIDRATYDAALTLAWNTDADVHDALLSAVGDKTR